MYVRKCSVNRCCYFTTAVCLVYSGCYTLHVRHHVDESLHTYTPRPVTWVNRHPENRILASSDESAPTCVGFCVRKVFTKSFLHDPPQDVPVLLFNRRHFWCVHCGWVTKPGKGQSRVFRVLPACEVDSDHRLVAKQLTKDPRSKRPASELEHY